MALQNNLISGPVSGDITYGAYRGPGRVTEFKFLITAADLAALGAFTTGDVILLNLPPNAFITHTFLKPAVAVVGPSISACTAQVQTATAARGGAALDCVPAVSATNYDIWIPITEAQVKEATLASATPVFVHFVATGANLSVVTTGSITVTIGFRVFDF